MLRDRPSYDFHNNIIINWYIIIHIPIRLARKLYWLKLELIEGTVHGWHHIILLHDFLVRNLGISPWMKTPDTLRRPRPGINPATYRSLSNCHRLSPFGQISLSTWGLRQFANQNTRLAASCNYKCTRGVTVKLEIFSGFICLQRTED